MYPFFFDPLSTIPINLIKTGVHNFLGYLYLVGRGNDGWMRWRVVIPGLMFSGLCHIQNSRKVKSFATILHVILYQLQPKRDLSWYKMWTTASRTGESLSSLQIIILVLYLLFNKLNLFHYTPAPNEIIMLNGIHYKPWRMISIQAICCAKTSSKVVIVFNWFPLMNNMCSV